MKRILAINLVLLILFIYLCSVFYQSAESLMLSFGLVLLFAILSNYILKIMKQNNNSLFVVFLILSFYMFLLKGLLIFINNEFSIYYKLNISFDTVDYIKTFIMIIIYYIIIFITYGSIEKKKIDLSRPLNIKGLKIKLITMITFLAVLGKYYFSVKYNYGLPGQIPSVFIISGLGGIVYLILSELSRVGLFYLFISANVMKNKMYLYISVLLMLLHSSLSALNGIKGEAVFIAIGILVYYFVFSSKKISFTNITIIFFVSVIFFSVADSLRNSIDYTDISIKYIETFIKVVRRSTGFDSLLNLVKYYDGQLFSIYNPNVDPIRFFTVQIAGVPENAVSAAAPTLFGYALIKFGYFVTLLISGIFGLFLKVLDKFIKKKLEHTGNILFAVFYIMTVFFLVDFFFEGNIIIAFKRYLVLILVMIILYVLKISKSTKRNYVSKRSNNNYENSLDNA